MPAYDYDCAACGRRFEVIHGVYDERPTTCPSCGGGPIRKAISAPVIHYKGSGWAKKERSATAAPKPASESSSGKEDGAAASNKEDGAAASKSEGGTEATAAPKTATSPTPTGPTSPAD